jgi:CheY-like chemotaxis protein
MSSNGEVGPSLRKVNILVVDDDALIAMSTFDMLEDLGHQVVEAHSAAEALLILERNATIELMITDFSMPKMNGIELAERALVLKPDLRILIATGYAEMPPGSSVQLPLLGKPYTQDQLVREIGKAIA